jgi:GNAT superfamily N-acetyltransferase
MSLTLRHATVADSDTVCEFNRRLAWETEHKRLDDRLLTAGVAAALADPVRGTYHVAERDGVVVGQLLITTEWSDWRNGWFWWIQSVYVVAEARGQGVFRALYQHVAKEAETRGDVVGLRLYVERDNLRAQAVYEHLGMAAPGYHVMERCPL